MTTRYDPLTQSIRTFLDQFPPRPDDGEEAKRRSRIMEVTLEIAAAEGVKGASLRRIAAQARIRTASLYSYFPGGKDDLVSTALAEHLVAFYRAAASALRVDDDARENLRRLVFSHTRWTLENPRIAAAILVLERAHAMTPITTGETERSIHRLHVAYRGLLSDLLRAAGTPEADVRRQAEMLIVIGDNADLWQCSGSTEDAQEFAWLAVRRLHGWGAIGGNE